MIRRCLYYSQLASREDLQRIPDIAKVGRVYCQQNQISGLLVFDGMNFCEYLEGPLVPMQELLERISTDSRHKKMVMLMDSLGTETEDRLFRTWGLAYVLDGGVEAIEAFAGMSEKDAMAHFQSLLPGLDLV